MCSFLFCANASRLRTGAINRRRRKWVATPFRLALRNGLALLFLCFFSREFLEIDAARVENGIEHSYWFTRHKTSSENGGDAEIKRIATALRSQGAME